MKGKQTFNETNAIFILEIYFLNYTPDQKFGMFFLKNNYLLLTKAAFI